MSYAMYIARTGLAAASTRLNASAHNVANAQTEGFRPQRVTQQASVPAGVQASVVPSQAWGTDLATELVEQMSTALAFKANLQVIRTSDRMLGAWLDTRA